MQEKINIFGILEQPTLTGHMPEKNVRGQYKTGP
jgi:hypothetical protein